MDATTKCKINPAAIYLEICGNHKSVTDRWAEGQTDGKARSFCYRELITTVVIDTGLSMMFDLQ